ncbi:hypothetical protein CDL12_11268 [Handroanthus impetiginosus]|uniref:Dof zinc finger protein n=1 Tax=Handroanthus impetiginosus TaxID=429701 RepID=A0A2G9HEV8_9LAMI|nr:hypothetical protein CDL12_11268 [Handroanthus impetiginosus]
MDSLLNSSSSPESMKKHKPTPTLPPKSPDVVSESGERRHSRLGSRTSEPEHLPCPRCDSTNTKFCYYNNYNLSQPRHFCKSCRRYWTRGGALRNVPVGGGTRKTASSSNKRPRVATPATTSNDNDVAGKTEVLDPVALNPNPVSGSVDGAPANLNEAKSASLSCWWSGGLFPLNSYGVGYGPGLGYDHGILNWPMEEVGGGDGGAAVLPDESSGCSTWQMGGGAEGGGVAEGDYFAWPELAISTPARALK